MNRCLPILSARLCNLLEDDLKDYEVSLTQQSGGITIISVEFEPFKIKTLKLTIQQN